jgi:flagellar motor protein MotB
LKPKFSGDAVLRLPVSDNRMIEAMLSKLYILMRCFLKHSIAILCLCVVTAAGAEVALSSETGIREANALGEAAEMHLPTDQSFKSWIHDPTVFKDEGDSTEMREVLKQEVKTIKLDNLVPPVHFGSGEAEIPENYIKRLREVLDSMRDRANVRLHFVGHADSQRLRGELIALYGDNIGLSRERAGTVAEYCQRALNLPPEAISYEGLGDSHPVASNETEEGRQLNRRVEVQVWYDEFSEKPEEQEVIVPSEVNRIKVCRTETVCKLRYKDGQSHRARIKNLIAPLHYDKGMISVPEEFLQQVRQAMTNLRGKRNPAVKIIAYADNTPLKGRDKRIYGDPVGLSKAVARRVALAVQDDMGLPNNAIESDGRGALRPVASNDTQQGRSLNRRVEVEFWHDDPLQDLPDEPQLCPDAAGAETVTRVYHPPSGDIDPILFEMGKPVILDGYTDTLRRIMDEIGDKTHARLRFIGYTGDRRLDRRTAAIYGDDVGLSMARAHRAMAAVSEQMGLTEDQAEFDGRGYVQTDDVVNAGFIESDTSRVEVQAVYDELIVRDDYEGVEVTPLTREVHPVDPFALNLMRITIDGKPIDDPGKCSSDIQRCTDVALENAHIQFKHDNLKVEPRLNVTAWPRTIQYQDLADTTFVENLVHFRLYSNYRSFIKHSEVRIFQEKQSVRDTPISVVEMDADGMAEWQPEFESVSAPGRKLKYLVRVYDDKGLFDETVSQPLWVVDHIDPSVAEMDTSAELLAGYGESRIAIHNIPLKGGTVRAQGTEIPEGHKVWMAGYAVPVDDKGNFVAEEILPEGMHTVEVAVLDKIGSGEVFLRDLALKKSDWFAVGIADMTLSGNKTDGPAELLAPDKPQYSEDMSLKGRLGFYTNGKFKNGWSLTASADTREGPIDEIFSNFMDKSPEALFRRIDPDYHYPTFGDDSTVTEDAPTNGKFYVKVKKDETYGLWGNFKIGYTDTDLAHVDRGLYGANLHYQPLDTTSFGEPRLLLDGFAADPGTVAGRDEFRGTDGSLYFLRRQDILEGSERLRIEVRDKDSGMVLGVKNLTPVLDYDIDYLQGRILLAQPLPTTADDGMLVSSGSITGNPVFLVVRYEFTPGFDDPNTLATGGRVHYWFNDHVKLGLTVNRDEEDDIESSLGGVDLTIRKSSASWIKLETGRTKGPVTLTTPSNDGGFDLPEIEEPFNNNEIEASAYRLDASLGFKDIFENGRGNVTFYLQDLEAGYSAPGKVTAHDLTQYGGTADLPFTDHLGARLKLDKQVEQEGLDTENGELDLDYRMGEHWTLSSGVRYDNREDNSVNPFVTQEEGDRTDAVARLKYDSRARWSTYGFVQGTVQKSGNREDNDRIGAGGSWRLTDRFNVNGEISGGDLGTGGKLGTEYLYSDRTTLYNNYTLENERTDNGLRARKGNMASGFRTRYSDSASAYFEERYTHGDVPEGLMHSTGVKLAPFDRFNFGANLDIGTLKDHYTAAELERTALGVSIGYGFDKLKIANSVEYRVDNIEDPNTASFSKRTSWLLKNSLKYQLSEDWRLIGKFDYAQSESSMGDSYDGDYTEAVLGYAYRPVQDDRLNALFKYTYFYNVPAPHQEAGTSTVSDFAQRSHIVSVDAMYDLTPRWTVGGKYGFRYGQVAVDRENPEYFVSRAHLYVLRADWHFIYRWDALIEGRMLDLPDAQDSRSGVLVGIYRHLGNHFKVGVGYNFCDFSDDLTQLDYKHQGLFINLIGKF